MSRRTVGYLAAMLVLGVVAFAGLGALVEWRYSQRPLPPPGLAKVVPGESPAVVAARGLAASAGAASEGLAAGKRSRAMTALDAALRVAGVGRDAVSGVLGWAFSAAHYHLEQARAAVANGDAAAARGHLDDAVAAMLAATSPTVAPGPASATPSPPWPGDRAGYRGAILLNAVGARIGEVVEVGGDRTGAFRAVLSIGGVQNLYGVIDIGGTRTTVAADRLVYGGRGVVGARYVVAPTFAETIGTPR